MESKLGGNKSTRRVYGFDEIALVPSIVTVNPDDADTSFEMGGKKFDIPIIASAMDSVIDPTTAALMSKNGGLGVLNLEGVQTRYEDANKILDQIAKVSKEGYVELMQKLYSEPIKNELIRGVNALSLDKFENLVNSGDTSEDAISDGDALKVLNAIALNSQNSGPCNRNSIVCETDTSLDVILDDLVNRDIIERKSERYYQIRVGLFKHWLIFHQ